MSPRGDTVRIDLIHKGIRVIGLDTIIPGAVEGELCAARLDWLAFGAAWAPVHRALAGFNLLHYSAGASR